MKKLFLYFLLSFIFSFSYAQSFEYIGKFDNSVMSKMTAEELIMYSKCVSVIGKDYEVLNWVSEDILEILKKDTNHFKSQSVRINSLDMRVKILTNKGKTTLGSEKYVLVLKRNTQGSFVNLLILY